MVSNPGTPAWVLFFCQGGTLSATARWVGGPGLFVHVGGGGVGGCDARCEYGWVGGCSTGIQCILVFGTAPQLALEGSDPESVLEFPMIQAS